MNIQDTYIAPQKELRGYTCPHCRAVSQKNIFQHHFQEDLFSEGHNNMSVRNRLTIHRCVLCGKKIIWCDDEYIYPDIVPIAPNPDMPECVAQLFREAGLIASKSPRAACALLRLSVERMCIELGVNEGTIDKNISKLVDMGLPVMIQQALDVVRVVGNKAVHPGQISFDVDDKATVDALMELLNIITERMISEPKRISAMYSALPPSSLEAIQRRDK